MTVISPLKMHRVFGIPELLDMVFRFLDDASNASNVRVCRQWSEIALDTLWRDVNDLHRLFGLLAPLQRPDGRDEYVRDATIQGLDPHSYELTFADLRSIARIWRLETFWEIQWTCASTILYYYQYHAPIAPRRL